MNDLQTLGVQVPSALTDAEANYIYHVEVLGMPSGAAAKRCGMPTASQFAPHIQQARQLLKNQIRGSLQITREDVLHGYLGAVDRARLLAEPMTEIVGWEKIAKLMGYDQPKKIDINITSSIEALQASLTGASDEDLAVLLGSDVIDADFYVVPNGKA